MTAVQRTNQQKSRRITSSQLYYVRETLGIHSIIQPENIRHTYRLHDQTQNPAFLFFCEKFNTNGITLIQNISQALSAKNSMIIEIISHTPKDIWRASSNICFRFPPTKGIIVFGENLSKLLHIDPSITYCVLCPLDHLLPSTAKINQEENTLLIARKKEVWKQLKKAFQ